MKRLSISLLFLALLAPPAAAGKDPDRLDALVKRYLEGLFRAKPHLATFMGDHRFDGMLPDLSADGEQKRIAEPYRRPGPYYSDHAPDDSNGGTDPTDPGFDRHGAPG